MNRNFSILVNGFSQWFSKTRLYITILTLYSIILILIISSGCGNERNESAENKSETHTENHHSKNNYSDEEGEPSIDKSRTPTFTFGYDGRLWTAWAFGKHVYVSFSENEGKTFSEPVKVNKEPEEIATNGENRPKIICGKNGNIYISYSISLEERFTGLVKFSQSNDNGKTFSEPITINDDDEIAGHGFESLGISNDGTIYVFWLDSRLNLTAKKEGKEYNGSSIFYTYSDDNGKTFKPNKKIADHVCQCCRIALDFENNFPVIVYRDIIGDNIRDHSLIRFKNKNNSGAAKRVTFENWKIDGCPHHGPSLYIDERNVYHLSWFNIEENIGKVYYAKSEDKGETFRHKKRIGNESASYPFINGSGKDLYITWLEFKNGKNSIKKIASLDGGNNWIDEKEIISFKENGDHPFLIENKNEIFLTGKSLNKIYFTSIKK